MRRLLSLLLVLAALAAPAAGAAREIVVERFDARIVVLSSGAFRVTERLDVRFTGSWNGIYRRIPVDYRGRHGFGHRLVLDVLSVSDGAGRPLEHETGRVGQDRQIRIWVPGARDAVRTVVVEYRVRNALLFLDTHDELYWNVTGDAWEFPIATSRAEVILPRGAAGVRAVSYGGPAGSTEAGSRVEIEPGAVYFRRDRPLRPGEGLTVVVGWDPGAVHRPGLAERAGFLLRGNWALLIPFLAFGVMLPLWLVRGRDPQRLPHYPRYEPPPELPPALMGALLDHDVDRQDHSGALVDLAVRGYIRIEELQTAGLPGTAPRDYRLTLLRRGRGEWSGLAAHQRRLLGTVFSEGDAVRLSELREARFGARVGEVTDEVFRELVALGYYEENPASVRALYLGVAAAMGVLAFMAVGYLNLEVLGVDGVAGPVAGFAGAIVVGGFGYFMPRRTLAGTRALERVLGFREFLGRVDAERLRRVVEGPEDFERFLPYAVALGVAGHWARVFGEAFEIPAEATWYRGSGHFHDSAFQSRFHGACTVAASTAAGGGSGFSGGGSGGGFGGGGGGGF